MSALSPVRTLLNSMYTWNHNLIPLVALILFIFAVTSGSVDGWGSASVIAPLVISVVLAIIFFIYEARIPEDYAAL